MLFITKISQFSAGKVEYVMKDTTKLQDGDGTKTVYLFRVLQIGCGDKKDVISSLATAGKIKFEE